MRVFREYLFGIKIIREAPVMAASAPSFSSCDVVPQQCYRRTAEESPAVSAPPPPHLQHTLLHLTDAVDH